MFCPWAASRARAWEALSIVYSLYSRIYWCPLCILLMLPELCLFSALIIQCYIMLQNLAEKYADGGAAWWMFQVTWNGMFVLCTLRPQSCCVDTVTVDMPLIRPSSDTCRPRTETSSSNPSTKFCHLTIQWLMSGEFAAACVLWVEQFWSSAVVIALADKA